MLQMLRYDSRREPEPWSCLIRRWHFLLTEYSQAKGITFKDTVLHSKHSRYPQLEKVEGISRQVQFSIMVCWCSFEFKL